MQYRTARYIYIYAFSRCFYSKRLTVHSGYTFVLSVCVCSLGIEPTTFVLLTQCSNHWNTNKINLSNFQLIRSDRDAESMGKSCGGGTCFYINERWCKDVTVLKKMFCSDLETLFINGKPLYSPREFCSFIREYLHPTARECEICFTETRRHRTKTPRLCFNHSLLI